MAWRNFGSMARTWGLRGLDELERLQSEMERLYSEVKRPFLGFPLMNVYTNADGAVLTAELPGVSIEDLDIHVNGNVLSLKGKRCAGEENATYHRRERETGAFARTLDLPFKVNPDAVEAKFALGILYVTLPRAEEDKPRKIEVKVG